MAAYYGIRYIMKKRRRVELVTKKVLKDHQSPLSIEDSLFKDKFGFDKEAVKYIHSLVAPVMKRNLGYPVALQVLVSLYLLRVGCFQNDVDFELMFHMSQSTLSRSFDSFLDAIMDISSNHIEFPSSSDISFYDTKFYGQSKIPNIMGVLVCFPVYLTRSKTRLLEEYTPTRQQKHSLNIQLVCDSELRVLDVAAHWPGSTANVEVWRNSTLRKHLKGNTMHFDQMIRSFLIGDNTFPLEPWLMVPYEDCQKSEELIFNDHINRALNIGKKFVIALKSRFKLLLYRSKPLHYGAEKGSKIIMACTILHNIALKTNQEFEEDELNEEENFLPRFDDHELDMEENLLRDEAMSMRDQIAKQLLLSG